MGNFNWAKATIAGMLSIMSIVFLVTLEMPYGIIMFAFIHSIFWVSIYRHESAKKKKNTVNIDKE